MTHRNDFSLRLLSRRLVLQAAFIGTVGFGAGIACTEEPDSPPPAAAALPSAPEALEAIQVFAREHPQFPLGGEAFPPREWAAGRRQVVKIGGENHEFYLEGNEVVTIRKAGEVMWKKDGYQPPSANDNSHKAEAGTAEMPAYVVLGRTQLLGGGVYGEVLMASMSAKTPTTAREEALKLVMKKESLTEAALYCSEAAQKADNSAAFAKAHPSARKCNLGLISPTTGGKLFVP